SGQPRELPRPAVSCWLQPTTPALRTRASMRGCAADWQPPAGAATSSDAGTSHPLISRWSKASSHISRSARLRSIDGRAHMLDIGSLIRDIPDFPKKGILFKDITTLLKEPLAFKQAIDQLTDL